jgi:O-methyltransferase
VKAFRTGHDRGKRHARRLLGSLGWELRRLPADTDFQDPVEATPRDHEILKQVGEFTMTGRFRVMALLGAVRYIVRNQIPGDFVECGVWRGGSAMAIALALLDEGDDKRRIWLYDTFAGMPTPSGEDIDISGKPALQTYEQHEINDSGSSWCHASLADVQRNISSTGFPEKRIHYQVGDVKNSLLANLPEEIALLRLDTDWYESTRLELEVLYPKLARLGVCVIDDYGHWTGARRAVDEYFAKSDFRPLLGRIDYTGRMWVKA